jgi:hypothetical protein
MIFASIKYLTMFWAKLILHPGNQGPLPYLAMTLQRSAPNLSSNISTIAFCYQFNSPSLKIKIYPTDTQFRCICWHVLGHSFKRLCCLK